MLKACFITHELAYQANRLFSPEEAPQLYELREEMLAHGIECATVDVCLPEQADYFVVNRLDLVFGQVIGAITKNPSARLILFAWEEPVVCGLHEEDILTRLDVDRVFCWRDDLTDRRNFIKINIPQSQSEWPGADRLKFGERKLIVAIDGFKSSRHPNECYSLRRKTLSGLVESGIDVDLYGRGWAECRDKTLRGIWRGQVDSKYAVQSNYRFTLCIQNSKDYPGDVCEKIFDAFKTGSIPIYHGAPNISQHVPANCFVDLRAFKGPDELAAFITAFSEDEYQRMREAASRFMQNGFREKFTGRAVAGIVANELLDLKSGEQKVRRPITWALRILWTVAKSLRSAPRREKWISLLYMCRSLKRAI
jgi:hypothetical protein